MKCPKCHFDNPKDTSYCGKCGIKFDSAAEISSTKTMETPAGELSRGIVFAGRYEIIEELGTGGMGKVYRAFDKKLNEEVALKLIRSEIASDKNTLERFSHELKVARKIVHKNVGRMYELMEDKGIYFITMEYVAGEDLKRFIKRSKQLSIGTSISITRQICEGLLEAHRLGIIHRDLKPHNIMIDKEGNAKIMDFGIARSLYIKGITRERAIIGTPEYMSPEQSMGEETDARSDIYSIGIILFELLTGTVPFKADTALGIALKQRTEAPPIPRNLNPQIPVSLNSLVLKCLEKEKQKRYQSIDEVITGILLAENTLLSAEKSTARKVQTFRLSKRIIWMVGIVLGAAVIIISVFIFKGQFKKKFSESATREEKKIMSPATKEAPRMATLVLDSNPQGAQIFVNKEIKGITPATFKLPEGTYEIRINARNYQEKIETIKVDAGYYLSKVYDLFPLYTIEILTEPPGAAIWIDDTPKGNAPVIIEWPRNTCRLRIEFAKGWTMEEELHLMPSRVNTIRRSFNKDVFLFSLRTIPDGALVALGNEYLGYSPVRKMVLSGTYNLKIEKDGFMTIQESITIRSPIDKEFTLTRLRYGTLQFSIYPAGILFIDGRNMGAIPPQKRVKISEGKHTIMFVSVNLKEKYSSELEVQAEKILRVQINIRTGKTEISEIKE